MQTLSTKEDKYQKGDTISITYIRALGVSDPSGASVSFFISLPKELPVTENISSHSESIAWIRGQGTNITSGLTVSGFSAFKPNVIEIKVSGTFNAYQIYCISINDLSFTI